MATIDGQKSVFLIPHPPLRESEESTPLHPATDDYQTHVEHQIDEAIDFAAALAEWLDDEQAQAAYQAWSAECRDQEREQYEADMERRAEAYELERLGDGYMHAIAGHDLKWQQGGS